MPGAGILAHAALGVDGTHGFVEAGARHQNDGDVISLDPWAMALMLTRSREMAVNMRLAQPGGPRSR